MSTNTHASESDSDVSDERPTLGSRDNFWGGVEEPTSEAYDVADEDDQGSNHSEHAGISRDRWVAGSILRGAPETRLLCPECWSELSDPLDHVPRSEVELEDGTIELRYTDHRRHRHCPTCGEIAWGGVLADVESEEFLEIVDRVLSALDREVLESTVSELREAARQRKSAGLSDEANLERMLIDVRQGVAETYN